MEKENSKPLSIQMEMIAYLESPAYKSLLKNKELVEHYRKANQGGTPMVNPFAKKN
jgi:hypothetical protein